MNLMWVNRNFPMMLKMGHDKFVVVRGRLGSGALDSGSQENAELETLTGSRLNPYFN